MPQGEMGLQGQWGNEGWEGEGGGAQKGPEKGHWGLRRGTVGERPFIPSNPPYPAMALGGWRRAGGLGELKRVDMERRWEAEGT